MSKDIVLYKDVGPKINFTFITGWVRLHNPAPVFDDKKRIIGWENRITDSDGRDEILSPIIKIVYGD